MAERDPWVVMMRAYRGNRGIRLTASEVERMMRIDHAIEAAALNCTTECTCDLHRNGAKCTYCEKAPAQDAPSADGERCEECDENGMRHWRDRDAPCFVCNGTKRKGGAT